MRTGFVARAYYVRTMELAILRRASEDPRRPATKYDDAYALSACLIYIWTLWSSPESQAFDIFVEPGSFMIPTKKLAFSCRAILGAYLGPTSVLVIFLRHPCTRLLVVRVLTAVPVTLHIPAIRTMTRVRNTARDTYESFEPDSWELFVCGPMRAGRDGTWVLFRPWGPYLEIE